MDVFTDYLNAYSRDASDSETESEGDSGGEDEDGDFGGIEAPVPLLDPAPQAQPRAQGAPAIAVEGVAGPGPAAPAGPKAPPPALDLRRAAGCTCPAGTSIDAFDKESIDNLRLTNASLDKDQLDLLLLGKISSVISRHAMTTRSHSVQTERRRSRCTYAHIPQSSGIHYTHSRTAFSHSLLGLPPIYFAFQFHPIRCIDLSTVWCIFTCAKSTTYHWVFRSSVDQWAA